MEVVTAWSTLIPLLIIFGSNSSVANECNDIRDQLPGDDRNGGRHHRGEQLKAIPHHLSTSRVNSGNISA